MEAGRRLYSGMVGDVLVVISRGATARGGVGNGEGGRRHRSEKFSYILYLFICQTFKRRFIEDM